MDAQALISILSFSKKLIEDAEIRMLWYELYPTPPEKRGSFVRQGIEYSRQEYRDAPQKTSTPEALQRLRKLILEDIEGYKTYGPFRDTDAFFFFHEENLVFQRFLGEPRESPQCNFRIKKICRFDSYPSASDALFPAVDFARYYDGGRQEYLVVNADQKLVNTLPHQNCNAKHIGGMHTDTFEGEAPLVSRFPIRLPPVNIEKTDVQIESTHIDGEAVLILTYSPFEKVLTKTYVRPTDIPEIFKEEHFFKSESPNANEEGYWLRLVEEHRDFVSLESLGIAHPKVFEAKEYRADGFMRRTTRITILDMAFNQGLPANFFDWNIREYLGPKESEKQ